MHPKAPDSMASLCDCQPPRDERTTTGMPRLESAIARRSSRKLPSRRKFSQKTIWIELLASIVRASFKVEQRFVSSPQLPNIALTIRLSSGLLETIKASNIWDIALQRIRWTDSQQFVNG